MQCSAAVFLFDVVWGEGGCSTWGGGGIRGRRHPSMRAPHALAPVPFHTHALAPVPFYTHALAPVSYHTHALAPVPYHTHALAPVPYHTHALARPPACHRNCAYVHVGVRARVLSLSSWRSPGLHCSGPHHLPQLGWQKYTCRSVCTHACTLHALRLWAGACSCPAIAQVPKPAARLPSCTLARPMPARPSSCPLVHMQDLATKVQELQAQQHGLGKVGNKERVALLSSMAWTV